MTCTAAARLIGVNPRTIHRAVKRGDLPAVRFGRVVRVAASALEAIKAATSEPRN